ncbi:MAG TPA: class A beta-lactamase-related serine hydrolase [Methylococcales bacterium]|nr:class A beta-lactamase-related serine hydrolase [Methylococcales bacterium]
MKDWKNIVYGITVGLLVFGYTEIDALDPAVIIKEEASQLILDSPARAISVVLVVGDSIKTHHFGEFSNGDKPSDDTLYDIGSITKTYTGLLLAQAVADGSINIDDPLARFLPQLSRKAVQFDGKDITFRDLATHLSGLPTDISCNDPDMSPDVRLDCFLNHDDKDLLRQLNDFTLESKPGTNYRYSNVGVRIIGIVLQKLYKKTFEQLLNDIVFQRTGQFDTYVKLSVNNYTRWRRGEHENGVKTPDASNYFNAAGGLKSTVTDMGKYLSFYLQDENSITNKALNMLAGEREGLGRAYIWNTFQLDTEGQYYHGGGTFGTSSWVSLYPREKLGIFLVTPYVSASMQEVIPYKF